MKNSLFLCVLILLLTTAISSGADATGRTVGNGGDVVLCEDIGGKIKSLKLLDFYEAQVLRGISVELGAKTLSVEEKVKYAISRIAHVSPARAKRYREHADLFFSETRFLGDIQLADIPDSGGIVIPRDCRIVQIANQSTPLYSGDARYVIDKDLWDLLDADDRAGLVLHEIVYREALELGHVNSVSARALTAHLCSKVSESMSVQQFSQFVRDLGFQTNEIQGVLLKLDPQLEFYANGRLRKGAVASGARYQLESQEIPLRDEVQFYESGRPRILTLGAVQELHALGERRLISPYEISFFESGAIESLSFESATVMLHHNYELHLSGAAYFFEDGTLRIGNIKKGKIRLFRQQASVLGVIVLHANGLLKEGYLADRLEITLQGLPIQFHGNVQFGENQELLRGQLFSDSSLVVGKNRVSFSRWYDLVFFPNSQSVMRGCLAGPVSLRDVSGRVRTFPRRTIVEFDESGFPVVQGTSDHRSC